MLLGVDVGTTKCAAVLVDGRGEVAAAAGVVHGADLPVAGQRHEQDPEKLLAAVWQAVAALPEDGRARVRAVGVAGQMHGVLVVAADGAALTPLATWQDRRCDEAFLGALRARVGPLHHGYGLATLAWRAAQGDMPAGAAVACSIHALAVARLCAQARPVIDESDAAAWGAADLQRRRADIAVALGLPVALLPDVVRCGARAGVLSPAMAARLGLPAGIPVCAGIGDNQASLLATLADFDCDLALTVGTGAQVSAVLGPGTTAAPAGPPWELRPFPGGRQAMVGAALCGGSAWDWLARSAQAWCTAFGMATPDRDDIYARLDALGLASDRAVLVAPHFLGERHDPSLRARIDGLDLGALDPGALARGLAQGIMENLRALLHPSALAGRRRIVGSGNALRRSALLRRAAEETFALPLVLVEGREEAATGAALLARALR